MGITRERLATRTGDGLELAIQRFHADARQGVEAGVEASAVILQHGLASNGAVFVTPGMHLAEHLAGLGHDCYVTELRGAGRSQRPRGAWGVNDYLEQDIPALLDVVREHSGCERPSWVGHSMGGILMLMYGIEHPDAPIERLVTVGTALDYRQGKSVHQNLRALLPLGRVLLPTVPFGSISQLSSRLAGSGPRLPFESMNFHRENIDRERMRWVMRNGFGPIPMPLLSDLDATFSERGLSRVPSGAAESERILYLARASELRIPTLMLGGSADAQCAPEATLATSKAIGDALVEHRVFGRSEGHCEDYGHFDLLVGDRAPTEVWPHIGAFLARDPAELRARTA